MCDSTLIFLTLLHNSEFWNVVSPCIVESGYWLNQVKLFVVTNALAPPCYKPSVVTIEFGVMYGISVTLRPRQNGRHFADNLFKCTSWMKMYEFGLKFHWSLFLSVQVIIFQRSDNGLATMVRLPTHIYSSLGRNVLNLINILTNILCWFYWRYVVAIHPSTKNLYKHYSGYNTANLHVLSMKCEYFTCFSTCTIKHQSV